MKEQIHTIPISDAFDNAGECPFCYIEKRTEDHVMDFVLALAGQKPWCRSIFNPTLLWCVPA